jgi:hypothetical protein
LTGDLEVSAARRPAGGGWWVDGRCGLVLFAALMGSLLFSVAFSFRNAPAAAAEAPGFVTIVVIVRFLSYGWLGCLLAPIGWALRHASIYIATMLFFDVLLLAHAFGFFGGDLTVARSAFSGAGVLTMATLSLLLLAFAFARSLSGSYKAGAETTRLYGRAPKTP